MGGCKKSDHKRRDCEIRRMSRGHRSEHAHDVDRRWPSRKLRRDAARAKRPRAEARAREATCVERTHKGSTAIGGCERKDQKCHGSEVDQYCFGSSLWQEGRRERPSGSCLGLFGIC